jgi:hypothetical protein
VLQARTLWCDASPILTYPHLSSPILTYPHLSSPILTYADVCGRGGAGGGRCGLHECGDCVQQDAAARARRRCSLYLIYWYKGTHTDAEGARGRGAPRCAGCEDKAARTGAPRDRRKPLQPRTGVCTRRRSKECQGALSTSCRHLHGTPRVKASPFYACK